MEPAQSSASASVSVSGDGDGSDSEDRRTSSAQHAGGGLTQHLADRTHTAVVTSSRTASQTGALSRLADLAYQLGGAALRLGLGTPQRVMLDTAAAAAGPVVLHTFLDPAATTPGPGDSAAGNAPPDHVLLSVPPSLRRTPAPAPAEPDGHPWPQQEASPPSAPHEALPDSISAAAASAATTTAASSDGLLPDAAEESTDAYGVPILLATVVAPNRDSVPEAQAAAAGLEEIALDVQACWAEQQENGSLPSAEEDETALATEA